MSSKDEKALGDSLQDAIDAFYGSTLNPGIKSKDYLRSALGWVYSCVGVIADEVAGINLHLVRIKNGEIQEIENHPALDLLYKPNNAMTRFDFFNLTGQYLELTGEAPWFVAYKGSRPVGLIMLRPDRLTVNPGKDGQLVGGYKYRVYSDRGYQDVDLEPKEVVYLKYSDPDNPLRGKGPLQAAALTVDLDNYAEKWNAQFFKNSASPSGAFKTEKMLSKEVRKKLEDKIKAKYEGVDNAHKTLILEGGVDFKQISLSQKDMDFINQQQYSRDKLLAIFRVPRTALGITDDVNRANAEATDYVFATRTIRPKMMRLVEQLNEFYLPLFAGTEEMYFTFDDPAPRNIEQLIVRAQTGVQAGYLTINEARELFGLDPIEGGDELRDPMGFAPLLNGDGQEMFAPKKKLEQTTYQKQLMGSRQSKRREKDLIENTIKESVSKVIETYIKDRSKSKIKTKSVDLQTPSINDVPFDKLRDFKYDFQAKQLKIVDEFEVLMTEKVAKMFKQQMKEILEGIDKGERPKLSSKDEQERFDKLVGRTYLDMMRRQARLSFQLVGISKELKAQDSFVQRLSNYFSDLNFSITPKITQETNDKLRTIFTEASDEGQGVGEIKTNVRQLFEDMAGYRAERIARTEIIRGSNYATEQAWIESGVVESKEWLATNDERVDQDCLDLNGKVVSLGKRGTFSSAGETVERPPLHVNCRCTLVPVVGTLLKPGEWRPTMNENQLAQFVKDSAIKGTWYHGTTDLAERNITQNGFNLSAGGGTGGNIIQGVYLTKDKAKATEYAFSAVGGSLEKTAPSLLPVKMNVKNVKTFSWHGLYDLMASKFGPKFTPEQAREELVKLGYDAIIVKDELNAQDYMAILDPRKLVIPRQSTYSAIE